MRKVELQTWQRCLWSQSGSEESITSLMRKSGMLIHRSDNCSTKLEANLALYSGTSDWSFEVCYVWSPEKDRL